MSQGFYGFPNILGLLRGTSLKLTGKLGATAGAGVAGGTTSGAPVAPAGPFDVGDVIVDQSGSLWICTAAGTSQSSPGSFTQVAAGFSDPTTTKGDLIVHGASTTRLGVGSDTQVLTADSTQSLGVGWATPSAASGLYSAYLCYQDQQAQGTNGGTFTSGAWRTRVLNTEVADTGNHGSLASNQLTLDAGTYHISAMAPGYDCDRHQLRLQNVTDSATLLTGQSFYDGQTANTGVGLAHLVGRFTIAASKHIELQHQCQTTEATFGFGVGSNFGTEIFATVELWKE